MQRESCSSSYVLPAGYHGWDLPSFVAGVTATACSAFLLSVAARNSSLTAFFLGAAAMLLLELVQLWLPSRVFDPLDALAGVCGAALMAAMLSLFARNVS